MKISNRSEMSLNNEVPLICDYVAILLSDIYAILGTWFQACVGLFRLQLCFLHWPMCGHSRPLSHSDGSRCRGRWCRG